MPQLSLIACHHDMDQSQAIGFHSLLQHLFGPPIELPTKHLYSDFQRLVGGQVALFQMPPAEGAVLVLFDPSFDVFSFVIPEGAAVAEDWLRHKLLAYRAGIGRLKEFDLLGIDGDYIAGANRILFFFFLLMQACGCLGAHC
jgi:hypothetical protein